MASKNNIQRLYRNGALSNTKATVEAKPCQLYGWLVHNPNAAESWVQIFNKDAASVTVGTTAPDLTIKLGNNESVAFDAENGIYLNTGFTIAATTTETGSAAPVTALSVHFFFN